MRTKISLTAVLAIIALSGLVGCGGADTNNANMGTRNGAANSTNANMGGNTNANTSRSSGGALSTDDREFMAASATGGMEEVELGRLAAQKAQSADVKKFGQQMVDDHSKANNEMKQLAARKGVTLPADMTDEQKADQEKLSKLSGTKFDEEYMKLMVDDHDKDVKEFEDEAKDGSDADVKSFAAKTLPTLQEHQRMAKEIKGKQ